MIAPEFDVSAFWKENELCTDRPFRKDKPRAGISLPLDDHWLLEEMQVPSSVLYFSDAEYRAELNRRCNDRCEAVLGRRFFPEEVELPAVLRIEEVIGSRRCLVEGGTPWLEPGVSDVEGMLARLDEIERWTDTDLREAIFSTGGKVSRAAPDQDGKVTEVVTGSRGPATQATSILGTMNTLYWLIDYPAEMHRFFDVLADVIVRYHKILEMERDVRYRGYYWLDDNCALFSPDLYEEFCAPVVRRVLAAFAPSASDYRYHHSDSEMRHLLPIMAGFDFQNVNLGPLVPASLIRNHMPHAVIHGCVAPNTLRNCPLDSVVDEVKRDFSAVGADGGLVVTTCGSISAGTTLESVRGLMWAVHEYTRYP